MIVGTANIDKFALSHHARSVQSLKEYSLSLIPERFRCCQQICNNQLYLCCITLRNIDEVKWSIKKDIINECIDVKVFGYLDEVIEIETILSFCDMDRVDRFLEVL